MFVQPDQISLDTIVAAGRGCICIDDAATPGQTAGSQYLHANRKTWVALLATPEQTAEMKTQLPGVLDELRELTGATELHFTEIYNPRAGKFKKIDLDVRLALFAFMRQILVTNMYPVIVQTLDPVTLGEIHAHHRFPDKIGPFVTKKPGDMALFYLLIQVKWYLQEHQDFGSKPVYVVMDEGFREANRKITVPGWDATFAESAVFTASSAVFQPLQLADFAAFCVARTQWLMTKKHRSRTDDAFLEIIKDIRINVVNLPEAIVNLRDWTPQNYEELIDADRWKKGLDKYGQGSSSS